MGILKRVSGWANSAANDSPAEELLIAVSPSIRRVRKLDDRGTPANGVITGIAFDLSGDQTRQRYAITVDGSRVGVKLPYARGAHRLRLGLPVVMKLDGKRGIIDWEAMCRAWGIEGSNWRQDAERTPPRDGIVDTSLDARVQKRLRTWTPTHATIVGLEHKLMMGMPTMNWHVTLRLPDGSTSLSKADEVPAYAWWDARIGAEVPAVVDPSDPSRAAIDWPTYVLAGARDVGFDDDPPAGSIAAQVEAAWAAPAPPPATGAGTVRPSHTDAPGAPVGLDLSLQSWVDAFRGGHMKQKDFDQAVADWQAAGMCTPAQALAARDAAAAAG